MIIFAKAILPFIKIKLKIMPTGTVKFFNESKGFGFITDNETGKEIFVHSSGLVDKIKQDDIVTFSFVESKKGPAAGEVTLKK